MQKALTFAAAILIGWVLGLVPTLGICQAESPGPNAPTADRAWCFEMQGEAVAYIRKADGEWLFVRPGKPANVLAELERDDEQTVLQNVKTKLYIRLTADQAFWRQPSQEQWTPYFRGAYGTPKPEVMNAFLEATKSTPLASVAPAPLPVTPMSSTPTAPVPTPTVPPPSSTSPENGIGRVLTETMPDYRVRVAYFVPTDRQPVNHWQDKIRVVVQFADSMYRNDLRLKGHNTPGLQWENEGGQLKVHLIRGEQTASHYASPPAYDANRQFSLVAKEVTPQLGKRSETLVLVFCENYDETPADVLWNGAFALGAYHSASGGLAMFSAHLLKDEFCARNVNDQILKFADQTPYPSRRAMGHRMNSPRCEFTEDGFGAVIHELGHALGLPHDFRDHDRYIMSNGFRNIRRNLSPHTPKSKLVTFSDINTELLMSSRFLNPEIDRTDDTSPVADLQVTDMSKATGQIKVRLTASDAKGLRAFAIFDPNSESMISGGRLEVDRVDESVVLSPKVVNNEVRVNFIVADNGGNQTVIKRTVSLP